jgi:hypothetical protein
MPATATSDCPTPTVSTSTTSNPAASQTSIASRVRRATPPRVPPDGDGRMNACGARDSCSMRVLSPRIEPPPRVLDGSTASTATSCPASTRFRPSVSMNVDFPAPGAADPDPRRAAGRRQQLVEKCRRLVAVIGTGRFHERDRLGERASVAGAHRVGERSHRNERITRPGSAGAPARGSPRPRAGCCCRDRTPRPHPRRAGTRSRMRG